jgi:hypothetical protein
MTELAGTVAITEALARYGLLEWARRQDNMRKAMDTPELRFAMADVLQQWKEEQCQRQKTQS